MYKTTAITRQIIVKLHAFHVCYLSVAVRVEQVCVIVLSSCCTLRRPLHLLPMGAPACSSSVRQRSPVQRCPRSGESLVFPSLSEQGRWKCAIDHLCFSASVSFVPGSLFIRPKDSVMSSELFMLFSPIELKLFFCPKESIMSSEWFMLFSPIELKLFSGLFRPP